jgi:U4/U6 small nuclear ribonucleoprotein PRP3
MVPVYLTKKERKKLRKATRAEREREKREKLMLGLIQAPEPKFKLSNFMKILGDQAVADPSKVEQRVMQQMQQRVLNHEMRNLANALTPKEKREKKLRKWKEDVSRGVTVAVFRVTDFSCLKYRFKVDINAQQLFLSGLVLLCPDEKKNLIVVEGGPRGIRKMIHLLTKRWVLSFFFSFFLLFV